MDVPPHAVSPPARGTFLTDFGLAREVRAATALTRSGVALGTPRYMSPEQARGDGAAASPAADVWSLGCVLYELLAAAPAFDGETPAAVIGQVLTRDPVPVRRRAPGCPPDVAALLAAALAKRPEGRPADSGAFRDDLARILRGERPVHRGSRRLGRHAGAIAVTAAGVVVSVFLLAGRPGAGQGEAARLAASVEALVGQAAALAPADPVRAIGCLRRGVELAPDRHDLRLQLGLLHWAMGDDPAALAVWAEVPRDGPEATRAAWWSGFARYAGHFRDPAPERLAAAVESWRRAAAGAGVDADLARAGLALLDRRVADAAALLRPIARWDAAALRALVLDNRPDPGLAGSAAVLREYDAALAGGVPLAWVHSERGRLLRALGNPTAARAAFDAALALAPGMPVALANRAELRWKSGDLDGALTDIEAVLGRDPANWMVRANRAQIRLDRGDLAGALADVDTSIRMKPGLGTLHNVRGLIHRALGDLAAAGADFEEALALDARDPNVLHNRGDLRLALGDPAAACDDFDRALALRPGDPGTLTARSNARFQLGDGAGALQDAEDALTGDPADAGARGARGVVRRWLGDLTGARADFDDLVARFPDQPLPWLNRALVRADAGDHAGALADLDAHLARDPASYEGFYNRAVLRMTRGEFGLARTDLDVALTLRPGAADALANRGALKSRAGDHAGAVADLAAALAAAPADWPARARVEQLLAEARTGG